MHRKLISALFSCWFATVAVGSAQTLDQEMAGLADKLSKALVAKGCKNVAALDFTDLQGQPTELGRYLSEQLTVEIVATGSVSMVDRANLKSILAEHKLTEEGLVNPANAKKLGEFAGVDAILIGNATVLDDGVVLMVKAVSTASAQIVAAGRIKFPKTSEIQQLFNRSVSSSAGVSGPSAAAGVERATSSYQDSSAIATKDIGPLRVVLKSVIPATVKGPDGQSQNGVRCSFEFINRETQRPIVVAMNAAASSDGTKIGETLRSTIVDERGTVWRLPTSELLGIGAIGVGAVNPPRWSDSRVYDPTEVLALLKRRDDTNSNSATEPGTIYRVAMQYQFIFGSMTSIAPGQSVMVSMSFREDAGRTNSGPPPKVLQISGEIIVGVGGSEVKKTYSVQNLMFDRVSMRAF